MTGAMMPIETIAIPFPGMEAMFADATSEGFDFVLALIEEWENGTNRFDGPGERLCGYREGDQIVAVGALTIDPFIAYVERPETGRIRRMFVRPAWRNRGIGRAIVETLIADARRGFRNVRLRAENDDAARLYERLSFVAIDDPDASHILEFDEVPAGE
jgi:GNAT superfamily N-acetyltransferase